MVKFRYLDADTDATGSTEAEVSHRLGRGVKVMGLKGGGEC